MSSSPTPAYEGLALTGEPGLATLAAALGEGAPALIAGWLQSASAPAEVSGETAARIAEVAATLSGATEAVVVHRFDALHQAQQAFSIVHDGRLAVTAADGPSGAVVSAPEGLDEVVARLAEEIGGRLDEGPPRTARIGAPAVMALRAVLGAQPAGDRPEALERLGTLVGELGIDADAAQVLAALESDDLLRWEGDSPTAGPALAREAALAAAAEGSALVLTRMSLAREGEPLAYDVRALQFAGPLESRCLVLEADDSGEIGFARLRIDETTSLVASHLVGRAEPALLAARQGEAPVALPEPGAAGALRAADLLAAEEGPAAAGLARPLLAPPAVIAARPAGGNRDRAEGIAVWGSGIVGWSWSHGAGHAAVEARDRLEGMLAAMLEGQLAAADPAGLLLTASAWADGGLDYVGAELRVEGGRFEVVRAEGLELPPRTGPASLAGAIVRAAGLAG